MSNYLLRIGSLDHKKSASVGRGMPAKKVSTNKSRKFAVLVKLLKEETNDMLGT